MFQMLSIKIGEASTKLFVAKAELSGATDDRNQPVKKTTIQIIQVGDYVLGTFPAAKVRLSEKKIQGLIAQRR